MCTQLIGNRENPSSSAGENKKNLTQSQEVNTRQSSTKSCDPLGAIMGPHDCHNQFLITGKACKETTCTAQREAVMKEANELLKIKESGNGE